MKRREKMKAAGQLDLFNKSDGSWTTAEDKALLDNWKKGLPLEKGLKRSKEEIDERLEILFEQEDSKYA